MELLPTNLRRRNAMTFNDHPDPDAPADDVADAEAPPESKVARALRYAHAIGRVERAQAEAAAGIAELRRMVPSRASKVETIVDQARVELAKLITYPEVLAAIQAAQEGETS